MELVWVTILSVYGQQQRDAVEAAVAAVGGSDAWEGAAITRIACALPGADGEGGDPAEQILRSMKVSFQLKSG